MRRGAGLAGLTACCRCCCRCRTAAESTVWQGHGDGVFAVAILSMSVYPMWTVPVGDFSLGAAGAGDMLLLLMGGASAALIPSMGGKGDWKLSMRWTGP